MAQATVVGTDTVVKNIVKFGNKFTREVNKSMETSRRILDKKVTENISLRDHSLRDLAKMGHPYARRSPRSIHTPAWQVHTQSGEMLDGKMSGVEHAEIIHGRLKAAAWVGISSSVKHAIFVILGTSKMIPRSFLQGSLNQVDRQIFDALRQSLKHAVVNFNGERRRL